MPQNGRRYLRHCGFLIFLPIKATSHQGCGSLREKGMLDMAPLIHMALSIAWGLSFIHRMPHLNIHGRIKSSNILFAEPNEVLISDLGCVLFSTSEMLTKSDDIFAFGLLLLEMLTGKNPSEYKALLTTKTGKAQHRFVEEMVSESNEKDFNRANKGQLEGMLQLCLSCLDRSCNLFKAIDCLMEIQRTYCSHTDPRPLLSRLNPGMIKFRITTYFNLERGASSVWLPGKDETSLLQKAILANGRKVMVRRRIIVRKPYHLLTDELDLAHARQILEDELEQILQIANVNRHPNILTPIACGMENNEFIIVYDYHSLHNIQSRLDEASKHTQPASLFNWHSMLHVLLGVARAFSHIQGNSVDSPEPINLSNVLLDDMENVLISDLSFITAPLNAIFLLETNPFIVECLFAKRGNKLDISVFGAIILKLLSGRDILPRKLYNERQKNEFFVLTRKCCQLPPDMSKCDMDELLNLSCSCLSSPSHCNFFEAVKIIENMIRKREVGQFLHSNNKSSHAVLIAQEASSSAVDGEPASEARTTITNVTCNISDTRAMITSKYNNSRGNHDLDNSHKGVSTADADVSAKPSPISEQLNDPSGKGLSCTREYCTGGCDQMKIDTNIYEKEDTTLIDSDTYERKPVETTGFDPNLWASSKDCNTICQKAVAASASLSKEYFEIGIPADYSTGSSGKFYLEHMIKGILTSFQNMLSSDPPFQDVLTQVREFTAALVVCGAPLKNWNALVQDVLRLTKQRESLKMQLNEEDFTQASLPLCTLQEEIAGLKLIIKTDEQQLENCLEFLVATESEHSYIKDAISDLEKKLEKLQGKAKTLENTILTMKREAHSLEERKGKNRLELSSREKMRALTIQRVERQKAAHQEKERAISILKEAILSKFASFPVPM